MNLNVWACNLSPHEGYGRYVYHVTRNWLSLYPDLNLTIQDVHALNNRRLGAEILDTSESVNVYFGTVDRLAPSKGAMIVSSMYEATVLPDGWADNLNKNAVALIVPCEWNKDIFQRGGVVIPIHVIYGGTDPEENPVIKETPFERGRDAFTFVTLGDRGSRKGWDIVYRAFHKYFASIPNARLVIKTRADGMLEFLGGRKPTLGISPITVPSGKDEINDRIFIWREDVHSPYDVFIDVDCVVYAARGEGWGMFPREAAMSGIPVISMGTGGLEPGADNWITKRLINYRMTQSPMPTVNCNSEWFEADLDEVGTSMLSVYQDYATYRDRARTCAQWMRENQTWSMTASGTMGVIKNATAASSGLSLR